MKISARHHFILVLIVVWFTSCEKNNNDELNGLMGSWIGTYDNNDTIIFESDSITGMFLFNRGYETRNGYVLPRLGSGPYYYEISKDSIHVVWGLSSSHYGSTVYFKFNESQKRFQIGIFATGFVTNLGIVEFKKLE